jgi:hypothetical protein
MGTGHNSATVSGEMLGQRPDRMDSRPDQRSGVIGHAARVITGLQAMTVNKPAAIKIDRAFIV